MLGRGRRYALLGLLLFAVAFGCNLEIRSALIQKRHTDVGTYFSGAWAIRSGSDPYFARDSNGWWAALIFWMAASSLRRRRVMNRVAPGR